MRFGLAIAAALGLGAALYFATLEAAGVTCELCMEFEGRTVCRSASAEDRDTAIYGARMAACAVLSQGVTSGMQCDRTPPKSLVCTP
ncbi:MAG: hypothetical protein ACQGVK_25250 [Myxococcota bacterium]